MKVILLNDVKNYGKKGDVVEVNDGYARNFLFPKKLAVDANKHTLNKLEELKEQEKQEDLQKQKEAKQLAKDLEKKIVEFELSVGKEGKVFGSISTKQVVERLRSQYKIDIDKRKIKDSSPLSTLGLNKVKVDLYKGIIGEIVVRIKEKQ
ncbi:MAG: 50S ribosomal protein L9 [Erysipelothrix sp.]|jgi:large subunit ribosomal protein L9|nr:50S ribosomal protein L9 [Erysipelothrix sp.]